MSNLLQPGKHLDADQLSAFLEGALPEHERLESLAHLAECGECRRVAFLAQSSVLPETRPLITSETTLPFWRWLRPVALVAAAAAIALLLMVSLHRFRTRQAPPANVAKNNVPPAPVSPAVPATPGPVPQATSPPEARTSKLPLSKPFAAKQVAPIQPAPQPGGTAGGVMGEILGGPGAAPASAPQQSSANTMASGNGLGFVSPAIGKAKLAPRTAADAGHVSAPGEPSAATGRALPSTGNANALPPATAGGPVATHAVHGSATGSGFIANGPLRLTIEHDRGPDNGLSALSGSVTDAAGAVIPQATITLRPAGVNVTASASASTDAQGIFTLSAVPAGHYEIQISSPGFQTLSQQIELQSRDVARLNSTLTVGAASQTVAVQAAAVKLETESAEMDKEPPRETPGRQPAISSVTDGGIQMVVDADGILYRSDNGGGHWKKIKPKWQGKARQVSTIAIPGDAVSNGANASGDEAQGKTSSASTLRFQLTTSSGEVWVSTNGKHWRRR